MGEYYMSNMNSLISKFKLAYAEWKKKELNKFSLLVFKFTSVVITYGVMINIISTGLLGNPFWIGSILGYGLSFYFATDEFPDWIRKIRRAR